jgi:nucleotide-binding universal stress UspA family protein
MMTILTPEIKTILIPVDGSVHARKAALVGAAIAAKFGARVVLLHILLRNTSLAKLYELAGTQKIPSDVLERFKSQTPAVYDFGLTIPAGVINPVASTDLLVEIGRRILETEKDVIEGQGVKNVGLAIEDDDAANKILEITKKEKADFVVMGRRGLGALEGMFSGSVSTKVSHLAPATVVSVT